VLLLDLLDLLEVSAAADLFVAALLDDFAPFHNDNVIGELREMDGVRDEDARAAVQIAEQSFADDIVGDVRVDSAEQVIEEIYVPISVECPRKTNTRLLPARKSHAFLAQHRLQPVGQTAQVVLQTREFHGLRQSRLVLRGRHQNVVFDAAAENPRLLRSQRHRPGDGYARTVPGLRLHFSQNGVDETGLAAADVAEHHSQFALFDVEVDVLLRH
jgi:hypothetical protein